MSRYNSKKVRNIGTTVSGKLDHPIPALGGFRPVNGHSVLKMRISDAGKIVFKVGRHSGESVDEIRLTISLYLLYLRFRVNRSVDKKILKGVLNGREEREPHDVYFAKGI